MAACNNNLSIINYLIKKNLHLCSESNFALCAAVGNGCDKIVTALVDGGVNICENNQHAVIVGIDHDQTEIVKYLIDKIIKEAKSKSEPNKHIINPIALQKSMSRRKYDYCQTHY